MFLTKYCILVSSLAIVLLTLIVAYPSNSLVLAAIVFGSMIAATNYVSWRATTKLGAALLWGMVILTLFVYGVLSRYAFADNGGVVSTLQFLAVTSAVYAGFLLVLRRHLQG